MSMRLCTSDHHKAVYTGRFKNSPGYHCPGIFEQVPDLIKEKLKARRF